MKALIGIASHNPFQITHMLDGLIEDAVEFEKKAKKGKVKEAKGCLTYQCMGFGDVVDEDVKVVMCPTVAVFLRNREDFEKAPVIALVFDDPVKLEHIGCFLADVNNKPHSYEYDFKRLTASQMLTILTRASAGKYPTEVNDESLNLLPRMLDEVEGSITQHLLTFLSFVPNTDDRTTLTKLIVAWLMKKGAAPNELRKSLEKAGAKSNALNAFMDYLKDAVKVKEACEYVAQRKAEGKSVNYKKLEKDTGVAAFDIKYLIKTARFNDSIQHPNMNTNEIHRARKEKQKLEMDAMEEAAESAEKEEGFSVDNVDDARKTGMDNEDSK
ncbi:hypothetical protein GR7B_00228 [Vibrio phage vB_VcorM_GR7B]|nr:hypothetical protein GR7B_00228 [Vibrio phage vB_VcorM_GR7B]